MIGTLRRLLVPARAARSTHRIAQLNDAFRRQPNATANGRVLFSPGVMALARKPDTPAGLAEAMFLQVHLLALVRDAFPEPMFDRDETRQAGTIEYRAITIDFAIQYLSNDLSEPARDPSDPNRTARVMIISLPEEENPYRLSFMLPPAQLIRTRD